MKVYYLNHQMFEKGDTLKAFRFALQIAQSDSNIDTITFLVLQKAQYEPFLSEMGFTKDQLKRHVCRYDKYKIQIHTVKTYSPNYQFVGQGQKEILITIGVRPEQLMQFEDKSNITAWIIVPWLMSENLSFLRVHEAVDFETNISTVSNFTIDQRVINAIGWLKATSYPNEGYHHPNDEQRLHEMANALKKENVPLDYDLVVYAGINNGLIPSAARKTADAFVKAQNRLFSLREKPNYVHLRNMMNTTH